MEVKEMKGPVESIQQKMSKANKPFYLIGLGGLSFNYRNNDGESDQAKGIQAGDTITIQYKESEYEGDFGKQTSRWVSKISKIGPLDDLFDDEDGERVEHLPEEAPEDIPNEPFENGTEVKASKRMDTKARMLEAVKDAIDIKENLEVPFTPEDIQKIAVTLYISRR